MKSISNNLSKYNPKTVEVFLTSLQHVTQSDGCTEIRILLKDHYLPINGRREYVGNTVAGYYTDYAQAARDIAPFDCKVNIYATLNPCNKKLMRRASNRLEFNAKTTAADKDIIKVLWFPFDTDPVRPAGTPASHGELRAALKRRDQIITEVFEPKGVPVIRAMSGNGGHGLVPLIGYPNTEETQAAIKRLLDWLSETYSDEVVNVDRTVANPARIWKVYGTLACKGDNTKGAPYRRAFIELPAEPIEPFDLLPIIDGIVPDDSRSAGTSSASARQSSSSKSSDYPDLDVDAYLDAKGIKYRKKMSGSDTLYRLESCPFNPAHKWDAQIRKEANGRLGFTCPHDSCNELDWQSFTAKAGKPGKEFYTNNRSESRLYEGDAYYYRRVKVSEGNYQEKPISSFIIKPKLRVWMDGKENLTVNFVTSERSSPDVVIRRRDWNGRDRFMDSFPSVDLQWEGQLNDIQHVLRIVANYDVPTKQGTTQLGRHDNGLWLLPNGTAYNKDELVTDPDLAYQPVGGRGELDDKIRITELDDKGYQELLVSLYSNIFTLNLPTVIIPIIGWFMSTPFKPLIQQKYRGFPLLSVSGRTGAGKSSLLDLMWRLIGISGSGGKLFSCTETDFVMLKLLSSTTSIPLVFDEYKPFDMPLLRLKALTRMLRKCYDGEKELRGRPDQTTIEYGLTAPVAIAGEVPLTEGALLERIISVTLKKNSLNNIMRKTYGAMRGLNLEAFMSRYIPFCLSTDFDKELNKAEVLATDLILGFDDIADRIQKNLVVMTFGFNQFMRFGKEFDIDCGDLTLALAEALTRARNAVCGEDGITRDALDYMLEHLAVMAETGRLMNGRDYIIRESYGNIALRFNSCFAEFRKYHRETQLDGEMLNTPAYKGLLKENHERGGYVKDTQAVVKFGRQTKRAVVINYELAESLGIDMGGFFGDEDD